VLVAVIKCVNRGERLTVVASDEDIAIAVHLLVIEKLSGRLEGNVHEAIDRL